MDKLFDAKRLIIISSFSEILFGGYIYKKLKSLNINTTIITGDYEIYQYLKKKEINCVLLNFIIPSVSNKLDLINLLKTLLIIPRLLKYKIKLFFFFKQFKKIQAAYYFGGHISKELPFIAYSLRNIKLICFDYYNWTKQYEPLFRKLKKIKIFFFKPSVIFFFWIYNFLSGSKYKILPMKDNTFYTIKQKKYDKEKFFNLSPRLNFKIIENYKHSIKSNKIKKRSVVILYQETDFFHKNFKFKNTINDLRYLLRELEKKGYEIYFKLHPHWNASIDGNPILQKYENIKFRILDAKIPIEQINFIPDFFIGNVSTAFKLLMPSKNNLIYNYENYYPYAYTSLRHQIDIKFLKSNDKNIFSNSIIKFINYI
tara:strand:+ start:1076 stop:2185 length:1110 start_codon:yes stop_codon:yes gene_type:complete